MGMTPDEFLQAFVEGNYEDCRENPGCVRRALNAAVSASHLADHYFSYCQAHDPQKLATFGSRIGQFVQYVDSQTNGSFNDIRSISNAYKHLYTDFNRTANATISSCGVIESIELPVDPNLIRSIEEDSECKVVFTRIDGQQLEFLPVLRVVVEFWQNLI